MKSPSVCLTEPQKKKKNENVSEAIFQEIMGKNSRIYEINQLIDYRIRQKSHFHYLYDLVQFPYTFRTSVSSRV